MCSAVLSARLRFMKSKQKLCIWLNSSVWSSLPLYIIFLKFLGIGNEQWGPEYPERLKQFVEVLRKAHPEIKIVGSSGPVSYTHLLP